MPAPTLFHPSRRTVGTIVAALALLVASGGAADARDRYGRYPGVAVDRDLEREWVLQLSPGSGVVPGYERPRLGTPAVAGAAPRQGIRTLSRDMRPIAPGVRYGIDAAGAAYGAPAPVRLSTARPARAMKRVDSFDPMYLPQEVDYPTAQAPGTIVIDTGSKFLYMVEKDGRARRYGVGVGKPGFEWAGTHKVSGKKDWPTWTPPSEMRARERAKGKILPAQMAGGPENPLGARAMYLGSSLYRIHGTNQPWSIGKAVSSGCIRMRNEDVMDLYERVPVGTKVVVL